MAKRILSLSQNVISILIIVCGLILMINAGQASVCLIYDENCLESDETINCEKYSSCNSAQVNALKLKGWHCSPLSTCSGKCSCQPKDAPKGEAGGDNANNWPDNYRNDDGSNNSDLYKCKISGKRDGVYYWECQAKVICMDKNDSSFVVSDNQEAVQIAEKQEKICNTKGQTFVIGKSTKATHICGHCEEISSVCKRGIPETKAPSGCFEPCLQVGKVALSADKIVRCCIFKPMSGAKTADADKYHRPEFIGDCYETTDKKMAADGEDCYKQQKISTTCAEGYEWNNYTADYEPQKEHCSCVVARCPEASSTTKPKGCFEYINVGKSAEDICWKPIELDDTCPADEHKSAKECPFGIYAGSYTACGKQCYKCQDKAQTCPEGQTDNAEKCKSGYDLGVKTLTNVQCYICKDENACPEGQTDDMDTCPYGFELGNQTPNGKQCYKCNRLSCNNFGYNDVCTDGCSKDVLTICHAKYLPNGLTCYETTTENCANGCGENGCALCPAEYEPEQNSICYDTVVGADGSSSCYKKTECCADKDYTYTDQKPESEAGYEITAAQGTQGGYCIKEKMCPENETTLCTESMNDLQCVICNATKNYSAKAQCYSSVEKSNLCGQGLVKDAQECEYGTEPAQATECGTPCYKCKACTPKDCSDYMLDKKPHTDEISYEICDTGCKQPLKYRCKVGYVYQNGGCIEPCPADYPHDEKCPEGTIGKDSIMTSDGRYCFDCGQVTDAEVEYRCADEWVGNTHYFYTRDTLAGYSYPDGCCVKDPCSGVYREGYVEGFSKNKDNSGNYWCCMAGYISEASSVYFPSDTPHCKYVGTTGTYCSPTTTGPSETHYFCKKGKLVGKKCVE